MRHTRVRQVSKFNCTRNRFERDMQAIRLKLLRDLADVFTMAKDYAQSKSDEVTAKQRQIWIRIMAYTGQVMNSISKTFDEAQVTRDLERLEKMINEAVAAEKTGTPNAAS